MTNLLDRRAEALTERYRIERQIGAGGMATVHPAQDIQHNRLGATISAPFAFHQVPHRDIICSMIGRMVFAALPLVLTLASALRAQNAPPRIDRQRLRGG